MTRALRYYLMHVRWNVQNLMVEVEVPDRAGVDAILRRPNFERVVTTCFDAGMSEESAAGILVGAHLARRRYALRGEPVS